MVSIRQKKFVEPDSVAAAACSSCSLLSKKSIQIITNEQAYRDIDNTMKELDHLDDIPYNKYEEHENNLHALHIDDDNNHFKRKNLKGLSFPICNLQGHPISDVSVNVSTIQDTNRIDTHIHNQYDTSQLFLTNNGNLNLCFPNHDHFWSYRDLCAKDKFYALLSLKMRILLPCMFIAYLLWAFFLSICLALVAQFDVERCLGGQVSHLIHFYFFTVETMFSIGFGSPRFPTCTEANWMVSLIIITTTLFNSFILGLVFTKFSTSRQRRWAISFSDHIVGVPTCTASHTDATILKALQRSKNRLNSRSDQKMKKISKRLKSVSEPELYDEMHDWISDTNSQEVCKKCPQTLKKNIDSTKMGDRLISQHSNNKQNSSFFITFRLMNTTRHPFFNPIIRLFLLSHGKSQLSIFKIKKFYTDIPLEFLQIPTSITINSHDLQSSLIKGSYITKHIIMNSPITFELLVSFTFEDNWTARHVEIRKSWELNKIQWNYKHTDILDCRTPGSYLINGNEFNSIHSLDS